MAETQAPVMNLIMHKIQNEFVTPETIDARLQTKHDETNKFFLFTVFRSNPMKIPATEYDILKAGPDKSP